MFKLKSTKIGILGGSFDPAHEGHLAISKIAIKKLKLKKIYCVCVKRSPRKSVGIFLVDLSIHISNFLVHYI